MAPMMSRYEYIECFNTRLLRLSYLAFDVVEWGIETLPLIVDLNKCWSHCSNTMAHGAKTNPLYEEKRRATKKSKT